MNTTPRRRPLPGSEDTERLGLADLLPPPPVPGLDPDRELLLKEALLREAAADAPRGSLAARASRLRPSRRLVVRVMAPAVACALAVGGVVAVNLADTPGRGVPTVPERDGADRTPEATRLLDRIALAAAAAPQPTVRAGQFVYVESKVAYASQSAAGGAVTMAPVHTRQVWLSADGSRPGLLREEGRPDAPLGADDTPVYALDGPGATPRPTTLHKGPSISDPTHQYVASLPTDPDALLKLIRDETRGGSQDRDRDRDSDPDQRAFAAIGDLLAETWAPPKVSAALYKAAAKIPGVTVVRSAADAAERAGIAVARTAHGQQTQWVFDRSTYAFLGERTVLTEAGDAGPAGTVVGASAVLAKAAVDRVGVIPASSMK
ncbi:CU044_5270 family protein [Streptomyces roseifaciens]|uniref:CU044_5270 family protein n=1 Tax=Streptomyces roseifaciens TaxID=1488406 RepID=UPI0007180DAE|nr:CU044_5270 family protein [Streptomyces roseifaciens]